MRLLMLGAFLVVALRTTAASAEEPDAPQPPAPAKRAPSVHASFTGGASASTLLRLPTTGPSFGAALAVETGSAAFPVSAALHFGKTDGGLHMVEGRLGFVPQLVLGRIRLGAGGEIGYGNVMRVAAKADDIAFWTFDLAVLGSVDAIRFGDRGAFFVGAQPSAGLRWGESVFALGNVSTGWRVNGFAGVRF
jgi:hypothetical protein